MLQLENLTPFASSMALFPDEEGIDTLYLMVKASFNIGQKWTLCDEQSDPVEADIYWNEPENSSLRFASDYHTGKPNSDIIMNGLACAPQKNPLSQLDVSLSVGQVSKTVKVFGDRFWQQGKISAPQPFYTMPMLYERSFGGTHWTDGNIESSEVRNPLGRGYAGAQTAMEMEGEALPNLEDPADLIRHPGDTPLPACFGYVAPAWQPRVTYAGTYDKQWKNERAPYLPLDFDNRFFNMAHPDLIYPGYLQGGEHVSIIGMHPDGPLNFTLPEIGLSSIIKMDRASQERSFTLETLLLEPNQLKLSMLWRSAIHCDKKVLKITSIQIKQHHPGTRNTAAGEKEAVLA